ncbi:hypothetical protein PAXRUDRAFT_828854 [Paxillus rubicundulus Ve08.2h10]|uniref:Unplaced genomic scaffold scaffold_354, whole genome shotgun sequence n=1 Tax=Paxillus rubicundulus Ve08.2h10 TaxID=930991 RepID=A0A0D0DVJ3_9AGAM|nr:hypothetical protein PAXRUDRAFT_828854 [Paxillus rubicundulus Ve08.2h10]
MRATEALWFSSRIAPLATVIAAGTTSGGPKGRTGRTVLDVGSSGLMDPCVDFFVDLHFDAPNVTREREHPGPPPDTPPQLWRSGLVV